MAKIAPRWLAVIIAIAAVAPAIQADEPMNGASQKVVERLIDQLGSERFEDREQATHQLSKLGRAALPSLKEATKSPDAEVRRRAQRLVEQLEPPPARSADPGREQVAPAGKSYL
jgi:HEAT repeat protein